MLKMNRNKLRKVQERHHKNKNKIDNRALFFVLSFNLLLLYWLDSSMLLDWKNTSSSPAVACVYTKQQQSIAHTAHVSDETTKLLYACLGYRPKKLWSPVSD